MRRFPLDFWGNAGTLVDLPEDTRHHVFHVLRLKPGERVIFFNGRGEEFLAELTPENQALILESHAATPEQSVNVTLAQALVSHDKFSTVLQKSTELGVAKIIPFACQRSLKLSPDFARKMERWQKIVAEAARQSERAVLPIVSPPLAWPELMRYAAPNILKIIAVTREEGRHLKNILNSERDYANILLLIGPEGGFTSEEVAAASARGFLPASLGKHILRTETAGLAALSMILYHFAGGTDG